MQKEQRLVGQQDEHLIAAGILFEGWPQSRRSEPHPSVDDHDIFVRGLTLTPSNFEQWLKSAKFLSQWVRTCGSFGLLAYGSIRHRDATPTDFDKNENRPELLDFGGGRDRDRTCDPYHVKVVLFR
jgi:hypothetical protein